MLDGLWSTTESLGDAQAALDGELAAVARMLRGHLELSGVTTCAGLSEATTLSPDDVAIGLAALEHEGFAMQGRYSARATGTEWVARRLLARIHGYSRRSRRQGFEPATAQDFMRFLLRWQHVVPDTQLSGEDGLVAVLEQLQGFEAAAAAWEPELFSHRLRWYEPGWLDGLCHAGQVAWLRLSPRESDGLVAPSKVTPTAVVLRCDLPWLLAAVRSPEEALPAVNGATGEVLQVLRERGASFASDLSSATRRLATDVERALWDGVARGLIMCDGFAAVRGLLNGHHRPPATRFSRLRRTPAASAHAPGRWSLVPPSSAEIDRHDLAEAVAEQLLNRWGVLFRDLAVHDSLRIPWREIQWALRRLEDRGLVRGGRFVAGFSGEQYALPAAVDLLTRVRRSPHTHERVVVNATDPLNLVGLIVPGSRIPAHRANQVAYFDGVPA
jgi:ATP-dependent Lhr-like helicase